MTNLRKLLAGAALIAMASASGAWAQDLKKVTIGVGTQVLNVTYPWLMMPQAKGYWEELGLDVDVIPVSGSLQAVQMLAAGTIDFAEMNANAAIQANVKNDLPLRIVMGNGVLDWSLVSEKDGPVQSVEDLKGKTVGVLSLASSGVPLLKAFLSSEGLDPENTVDFVATGAGAPALLALQSGQVDALMFWGSMNLTFENMGAELNKFYSEDWRHMPDFSLVTTQGTIESDPELVTAVVRGAVMGTEFALASPDCTRRTQWAYYPDSKPGGAPDDATAAAWDDSALGLTLEGLKSAEIAGDGENIGSVSLDGLDTLQQFMLTSGQIDETMPPETFLIDTPEFFATVNEVDVDKVKADAEACDLP